MRLCLTFGAGAAGVAAGWAGMRVQVRRNTGDIGHLQKVVKKLTGNPTGLPVYIRRDECEARTGEMGEKVNVLATEVEAQNRQLSEVQNFARYMLTKEGLTLGEVNEILGGD